MTEAERLAALSLARWKRDPVNFAWENFRFVPDQWQETALRAFGDPDQQRIALQACVGVGKTSVLAICAWQFLSTHVGGDQYPMVAVMSATSDNLRSNLWKELAVWRDRSDLLRAQFEMTAQRISQRDHPDTWFLGARTFAKTADLEAQGRTLSGLHARYIAYFIDESGDISPSVLRAAEQGLSNCEIGKIMQAGNPTSHEGMLYLAAKEQPDLWRIIQITSDPDDPKRSTRVGLEWARQQIAKYGRANPWVMATILGKFPPTSINALLGPDEVRESMARELRPDQYSFAQRRLGIDIARFGDDATVLFPRQGLAAFNPVELRGQDSTQVAARIMEAKRKWNWEMGFIDATGGHAGGVIDALALGRQPLFEVNFSGRAMDPRYFNLRSELHFLGAEWVKGGGALPNVPELAREAAAPTYWFEKGKLRVVEKDQIKTLLGRSPDFYDSFLTTFAIPDMPTQIGEAGLINQLVYGRVGDRGSGFGGHSVDDWDPHAEDR